jgi:hypothetical protein
MKVSSVFMLASIAVACAAFSAGAAAQVQPKSGERYQITPVGGGPGQWQTMPADSRSDSRAGPGIPESFCTPSFQVRAVLQALFVVAPPSTSTTWASRSGLRARGIWSRTRLCPASRFGSPRRPPIAPAGTVTRLAIRPRMGIFTPQPALFLRPIAQQITA